jgi:hypothetical protein
MPFVRDHICINYWIYYLDQYHILASLHPLLRLPRTNTWRGCKHVTCVWPGARIIGTRTLRTCLPGTGTRLFVLHDHLVGAAAIGEMRNHKDLLTLIKTKQCLATPSERPAAPDAC